MITVAFFDDRPPQVIEYQQDQIDLQHLCGLGIGGCVLVFPNFKGDRCFAVVTTDPEKRERWSKATRQDCKNYNDAL